jgi:mRNA-degrading endonuclease YafQ of YafQ-DinJ toxin-antitoxin module
MNQLILSSAFQRQLRRLVKKNPQLKDKVAKIFKLLVKDISHSSLRLHKFKAPQIIG